MTNSLLIYVFCTRDNPFLDVGSFYGGGVSPIADVCRCQGGRGLSNADVINLCPKCGYVSFSNTLGFSQSKRNSRWESIMTLCRSIKRLWYFVTKIVLTNCEKKLFQCSRKFSKVLRSQEQFIQTVKGQNSLR